MRRTRTWRPFALGVALGFSWLAGVPHASAETWKLQTWERPFDYESPSRAVDYTPLEGADRAWHLCASYPHLKDSYWLSVNYGMVETARSLGVELHVYEAGGYPNVERQRQQIKECVERGADALLLGTVSFDELTDTVVEVAETIPVIATVNDIADPGITAKVGVPWRDMGRMPAAYLAAAYPSGGAPVHVAWFPGPKGGWAHFVEDGFHDAIADSSARIVTTKWGDTGVETQLILLEEALEEYPEIDYVFGSAVTAEAAMGFLRARGRLDDVGLFATYFTHGVFRGIKRGRIVAAPNDYPVLQGRLTVDMAVRVLQDETVVRHAGPVISIVDKAAVDEIDMTQSLSPATFTPTFAVVRSEAGGLPARDRAGGGD